MNLGKYTVSLTHLKDRRTVEFTEDFTVSNNSTEDWSDWQRTLVYLWRDGNYSCNCNRYLFFERALGTPDDELDQIRICGEYDRYRVNFIKDESGNTIYTEQ